MMSQEGIIYRTTVWITRLAYLNLLWLLFTIVGLVILGFYPATVAMFAIERRWIRGNKDLPMFKTFKEEFFKNFKHSNIIGHCFTLLALLIYINYQFVAVMDFWLADVFQYVLFALAFLTFIIFMYIFPVFVHYQVTLIEAISFAFVIALSSPLNTVLILVNVISFFFIAFYIPGIIPVFMGSAISFITMWFAYRTIQKIDKKNEASEKLFE